MQARTQTVQLSKLISIVLLPVLLLSLLGNGNVPLARAAGGETPHEQRPGSIIVI